MGYSVVLKKMTDAAEELHVHFDENNDGLKSNNAVVRKKGDRKIEVQLGFLQVHHTYEVTVVVDRTFFPTNCVPRNLVQKDDPVPNINCRVTGITDCSQAASNVELSLRFSAVKEKLTREKFSLVDSDSSDGGLRVDMELVARVLGKGKGTPMIVMMMMMMMMMITDDDDNDD